MHLLDHRNTERWLDTRTLLHVTNDVIKGLSFLASRNIDPRDVTAFSLVVQPGEGADNHRQSSESRCSALGCEDFVVKLAHLGLAHQYIDSDPVYNDDIRPGLSLRFLLSSVIWPVSLRSSVSRSIAPPPPPPLSLSLSLFLLPLCFSPSLSLSPFLSPPLSPPLSFSPSLSLSPYLSLSRPPPLSPLSPFISLFIYLSI